MAIRDFDPDSTYSVSPDYHEALFDGMHGAARVQEFEGIRLSERDPLGLRFIAGQSFYALFDFISTYYDIVAEDVAESWSAARSAQCGPIR